MSKSKPKYTSLPADRFLGATEEPDDFRESEVATTDLQPKGDAVLPLTPHLSPLTPHSTPLTSHPSPLTVSLDLPFGDLSDSQEAYLGLRPANGRGKSYVGTHVDVQLRGLQYRVHRIALQQLQNALDATGARLESGRRVQTAADAIRYVLERYAAARGVKGELLGE